jgi:hypothetical protein
MSEHGFSEEIKKTLQEELKVHTRRGAGSTYNYFKGEDVIKQLNKAFGHCWSSEVISADEVHGQILIQASVSVFVEGDVVVHHGYGSSIIARAKKDNAVIDIGNSYKSAYTSAIKKAAEQFGIGLGETGSNAPSGDKGPTSPGPSKTFSAPPQHQSFTPPPKPVAQEPKQSNSRPPLKPAGGLKPRLTKAPAPDNTPMGAVTGRINTSAPNVSNSSPGYDKPASSSKPQLGGLSFDSQSDEMSGLLSDAQKGAIQKLTDKKGITVASAIEKALKDSSKTLDTLTKAEAVLVIRFSNTVRAGA